MADGSHKAIEDIEIGDMVWASDPETGEEGPRKVLATIVGEGVKTLVEITVDTTTQIDADTLAEGDLPEGPSRPGPMVLGDAIIATDGHPFWVPLLGEWVDAADLVPGMWFLSSEGTLVQITGTRTWTEPERVYNLTVQDLHTYYVLTGDLLVLTHNCLATNMSGLIDSLQGDHITTAIPADTNGIAIGSRFRSGFGAERDRANGILRAVTGSKPYVTWNSASHSEPKIALWMNGNNIGHVNVAINQNYVCGSPGGGGCLNVVPVLLEAGRSMNIWYNDQNGSLSNAGPLRGIAPRR
jgi:hypothetical protein